MHEVERNNNSVYTIYNMAIFEGGVVYGGYF